MGTTTYLYGIEEKCWYKLQIDEAGHYQLFSYSILDKSSGSANQNSGHWQATEFPSELVVWESELGRANRYFVHNDNGDNGSLYRYSQKLNIIPPALFAAVKKIGEREAIDEDEMKKVKAFKSIWSRNNGFYFTNKNGEQNAGGQQIQKYENKEWVLVTNAFNTFANLEFVKHPTLLPLESDLPKDYSPLDIPSTLDPEVDPEWLEPRNQQPEVSVNDRLQWNDLKVLPGIAGQLDKMILEFLDFKKDTKSRKKYLALLRLLLGESKSQEELKADFLLQIVRLRVLIRKPNFYFDMEETTKSLITKFKAEDPTLSAAAALEKATSRVIEGTNADTISSYLLKSIEIEYKAVARHDCPFTTSVDQLPQSQAENTREHDRMYALYTRLLNTPAAVSTHDFMEIMQRLGSQASRFPVNEYNLIASWLVLEFSLPSAALERILLKLSLNKLELFAESHRDFVMALTDQANFLTDNLLWALAVVNKEFALAVLDKPALFKRMTDPQKAFVSVLYPEFSEKINFTNVEVLKHLSHSNIKTRALEHGSFSVALLKPENEKIVKILSPDDIREIANDQRSFALAVLCHPLRTRVDAEELYVRYEFLEWDYLYQQSESRDLTEDEQKRFQIINLARAARNDVKAAKAFIRSPVKLWANRATDVHAVFEKFSRELAGEILQNPQILDDLVVYETGFFTPQHYLGRIIDYLLRPVSNLALDFMTLFKMDPSLLTSFASTTLWLIAINDRNFALHLLEHPTRLSKMSGLQLYHIIIKYPSFATTFYERMVFADYSDEQKHRIISAYAKLAENDDQFAHKFFRKREFLPYLPLYHGSELRDIVKDNPERALALLQDNDNYLDDLEKNHLSGIQGDILRYFLSDEYILLAVTDINIARAWLTRSGFLRHFDPKLIIQLASNHHQFAMDLINYPELLKSLCGNSTFIVLLESDREFTESAFTIIAPVLASKSDVLKGFRSEVLKWMADISLGKDDIFHKQLLEHPEALLKLDIGQLRALFEDRNELLRKNMPSYGDFEISNEGNIKITRKKQKENNAVSFEALQLEVVTKLMAYNLFVYVNKPIMIDMSENTFSQICLSAVSNSKNKSDLIKALKSEEVRLQKPRPYLDRFFKDTPSFMLWLKMQMNQVNSFTEITHEKPAVPASATRKDMSKSK